MRCRHSSSLLSARASVTALNSNNAIPTTKSASKWAILCESVPARASQRDGQDRGLEEGNGSSQNPIPARQSGLPHKNALPIFWDSLAGPEQSMRTSGPTKTSKGGSHCKFSRVVFEKPHLARVCRYRPGAVAQFTAAAARSPPMTSPLPASGACFGDPKQF